MEKPHIIIDKYEKITIPEELKNLITQHSHNVTTFTFDCPRYCWDGHDMSEMQIFVRYMDKDGSFVPCECKNVQVDEDGETMHFDWTLTKNATKEKGILVFVVCITKVGEGSVLENHWNTRLCKELNILESADCYMDKLIEEHPDLILSMLLRLDALEKKKVIRYSTVVPYYVESFEGEALSQSELKDADGIAVGDYVTDPNGDIWEVTDIESSAVLVSPRVIHKGAPDEIVVDSELSNPLSGKKVSFNGDSICYGVGYEGGYGKIIAGRNNMTYQNIARGGATITAETYTSSGAARTWLCRTIENMDNDSDYAIIEGGINDTTTAPLGKISSDYDSELDDTTYYGAFESMLKQLVTRFAGKKIGYIAIPKMNKLYDSRNNITDYYHAALECCEKWGVPVCDLNVSTPPIGHIDELSSAYTTDGLHPNEEGYRRFFCDQIEGWMKSLSVCGKSSVPKIVIHNQDNTAHEDIRLLIQQLTEQVNKLNNKIFPVLPEAYQAVEYIQSDGAQYIDTGVLASDYPNGIKEVFTGVITEIPTSTVYLWGALSDGLRAPMVRLASGGNALYLVAGSGAANTCDITIGEKFELLVSGTSLLPNDIVMELDSVKATNYNAVTATEMPPVNIYLLKCNGSSGTEYPKTMLYSFTMDSADGTPIRNFVPCYRIADGVIGLYDTVGGIFYENAGTGSFTKGPDV